MTAAALAIAEPDALLEGDSASSLVYDDPIVTLLMTKSPVFIAGTLPGTSTDNVAVRAVMFKANGVAVVSLNV